MSTGSNIYSPRDMQLDLPSLGQVVFLSHRSSDKPVVRAVLVNPLLGFSPEQRPVYWRVLAIQGEVYSRMLGNRWTPFDDRIHSLAKAYVERAMSAGA